ncbi:uncharacterized protein L203_103394 [Cryptococcus depauperatus CBS 7841]|uniref:Uncharacterized protein n=1 Tax=Cryptococcus depauperatus CBS 7841 TaxID=1295531 RepID=A0A1E3I1V6_9TREE|nr:hypothetical protein L203_05429 [Cryptococcus depauperatus CBS 7841]
MSDPRFESLKTDPRFRRPRQKNLKVEIDERFRDVLESEEFGGNGKGKGKGAHGPRVDKRGRPVASSHHTDQLKRFYRLQSPTEDDGESKSFVDYARGEGALESSGSEDESEDVESDIEEDELELGGKTKARLPVLSESEVESDSTSDDEHLDVDLSENEESVFLPETGNVPSDHESEDVLVQPTKRIAAVNLDWDNLQAADLFAVFNSFLSKPVAKEETKASSALGKLVEVRIYPSEFGKERMAREEKEGPGGGIFIGARKKTDNKKERIIVARNEEDDKDQIENEEEEEIIKQDSEGNNGDEEVDADDNDDDEFSRLPSKSNDRKNKEIDGLEIFSDVESEAGSEDIDMDQLRQYQLERLRYYYAIAVFSTVAAAELVMNGCDGTEFEQTANIMDLSYVPDGMTFDEDSIREVADKEPKGYKGNDFVTDALRHSKVQLTWDQDDPNRIKVTRRTLTREEIEEEDFKNLVASSGSETEESGVEDSQETVDQDSKKEKKQRIKERKERLRNLLLTADEDGASATDVWGKAGTSWANELEDIKASAKKDKFPHSKNKDNNDLKITFRPALSTAAKDDVENMTSLERYQMRMKEKRQRKKEKMDMKATARENDGEEEIRKNNGKDDFFGSDSSDEETNSRTKHKTKDLEPSHPEAGNLAVLIDDNEPDTNFSMKDILKEEKEVGKKRKRRKNKKGLQDREKELGPENWKIDVRDERFKALHEEPEFAIDPSNPHFVKTRAMQDLLAERTRRRNTLKANQTEKRNPASGIKKLEQNERDLESLVQSVKRKMGQEQHKPKRKRSRK